MLGEFKSRQYAATHIDEDCTAITGQRENELFWGCTFKKLSGLTLKDCVLTRSKFLTDSIRDALNFTWTVNCFSTGDVELSPLLFDLLIVLLIMSRGKDEKRRKLASVLGRERLVELYNQIKSLE